MLTFIFAIFVILHAIVHGLYFGQSWGFFELKPGLVWPTHSWVFSRFLSVETTRLLGSIACLIAALGFVVSGLAILFKQGWWRPLILGAAAFSSVLYLLFWDGKLQNLDDQGGIGLLIDLALLVAILVFRWPEVDF
jgi:hypothetical protein